MPRHLVQVIVTRAARVRVFSPSRTGKILQLTIDPFDRVRVFRSVHLQRLSFEVLRRSPSPTNSQRPGDRVHKTRTNLLPVRDIVAILPPVPLQVVRYQLRLSITKILSDVLGHIPARLPRRRHRFDVTQVRGRLVVGLSATFPHQRTMPRGPASVNVDPLVHQRVKVNAPALRQLPDP